MANLAKIARASVFMFLRRCHKWLQVAINILQYIVFSPVFANLAKAETISDGVLAKLAVLAITYLIGQIDV